MVVVDLCLELFFETKNNVTLENENLLRMQLKLLLSEPFL
jgi:hypothetical protein